MESTSEERTMPGAFLSNDELPDRGWSAPREMPAPLKYARPQDLPSYPTSGLPPNRQKQDVTTALYGQHDEQYREQYREEEEGIRLQIEQSQVSQQRNDTMRYSPMPMRPPLKMGPPPEMPAQPVMPAPPKMPSIPQMRAMPVPYVQHDEGYREQEERTLLRIEQSNQRRERVRQHDETVRRREEEACRQHDEALRRHDEAIRQQDELFREHEETPVDGPTYTSWETTPDAQMRTMPGSFEGADDYGNHFTSYASLPSQPPSDPDNTPYRGDLHILDPSSHYSRVLNGQIGNSPEVTVRRTPSARISQNVGLASAALRRNPSRRENVEMSANLAGKWPTVDIDPYMAYEVVRASPTPPRTPKPRTPNLGTPTETARSRSGTPATGTTTSATLKPTTPNPATSKPLTPKPPAPKTPTKKSAESPTREEEHKVHMEKIAFMEASQKYWSQTGSQYDVQYTSLSPAIQTQLSHSTPLGAGGFGTVERVLCSGVPLARKSLRALSKEILVAIRREVDAVRRLAGHHHIVQLVGTYLTTGHGQDMFHMLTFPVADCDMDTFLRNYEASLSPPCDVAITTQLSTAAGLEASTSRYTPLSAQLSVFLKGTLGCITSATEFMRRAKISHDDIKPANILLRAGQIYITDFGISRDRRLATQSSTEFFPGLTHGWSAPEKGDRHDPFKADVYSVGCIFMHVVSLLSGKKTMKDCSEILQSPAVYREAFIAEHFRALELAGWGNAMTLETWKNLSELTREMLLHDRTLRPAIGDVDDRLLTIGGEGKVFHGKCCRQPPAQPAPKLAETPVTNGAPKAPSMLHARQSTPLNSRTITPQTSLRRTPADDDNSVTIVPATLRARATKQPTAEVEMPADGEVV